MLMNWWVIFFNGSWFNEKTNLINPMNPLLNLSNLRILFEDFDIIIKYDDRNLKLLSKTLKETLNVKILTSVDPEQYNRIRDIIHVPTISNNSLSWATRWYSCERGSWCCRQKASRLTAAWLTKHRVMDYWIHMFKSKLNWTCVKNLFLWTSLNLLDVFY